VIRTQAKACATIILLTCCPCAFALNPSLDISQYAHKAWTVRDGFFKGIITSIAQTPDGYLWLGTEFGLLRFDGVRSVPWAPPKGNQLPGSVVRLLAARDGRLWIGTNEGLASWKNGNLTRYPALDGQDVLALREDRMGTVWVGTFGLPTGRLCAIQSSSNATCYGEDGSLGRGVISLYEDIGGNLWAGATTGLWRWKPGPPKRYPTPDQVTEINALIESDDGALWMAMPGGIRQLVHGKVEAYPPLRSGRQFRPNCLLRDRNGGLWIGTQEGLLHAHQGRTDLFTRSEGLSGDFICNLFEDREGNIWVATVNGLDRFRDFAVHTISIQQGLSNATVVSVLAAKDGSLWLGTISGLNRWNDGQFTIYRKRNGGLPDDAVQSLFQDDHGRIWVSSRHGLAYLEDGRFIPVRAGPTETNVYSIAGNSAGNIWISQDQDLVHLTQGSVVERIPWARLGHKGDATALSADPLHGGLWLGFFEGGVAYFEDGQVRALYKAADGLGAGAVTTIQLDRDGTLWAATQGGLSRVKNGRVATLTSKNGLPCDTVQSVTEDDDRDFWLGMECALVRIARPELDTWLKDSRRTIQATVFDSSEGVMSHARPFGYSPHVAKTKDGKLWFVAGDGISVVDPRHLPFNKLPPPIHIEQITADRKLRWQNLWGSAASNLRLPPLSRDLQIDYTALSFVAPEKVRFRVKLEGHDPDWKDAGNERKAFYNDLPPRHYRFRVMASNNSGVWNEAGDSLDFSIDPAYYQTRWFQASCVGAFLVVLWGLYRYRLHQIAQQFNVQLETRVDERTRIARELHDTLLQSFQGLMLRLQVVGDRLPPGETKEAFEKALERGDQAIVEGREAVYDLRSSTEITNDLAEAMKAVGLEMGQELAGKLASEDSAAPNSAPNPAKFRVMVEGPSRNLHPILRDEIYRIAREAVRNAFSHARASEIEAEVTYGERLLRLRIRDDGRGMDPETAGEGRAGHYGLPGMRERAKRIGGQLKVWTAAGAGTEIELTIPSSIAYGTSRAGFITRLKSVSWTWWNRVRADDNRRKSVPSNKEEP